MDKKTFYKGMLAVGLPVALQNLIASSLNMVDTFMITRVGEQALAAVGLANQIFFVLMLMIFGITSGAGVFVAQFWGKEDIPNIRKTLAATLLTAMGASFVFFVIAFFLPKPVMTLFIDDPVVIKLGADYLRIVAFSYLATAISFSIMVASRSIGHAKLPMMVSAISLSINTVLNYLLIFGVLGFPALGVKGAAIATLIARIAEMIILLRVVYKGESPLAVRIKHLKEITLPFMKRLMKTSLPVVVNELFWSLGMVMYTIAVAKLGSSSVAAYQVSQNIFRFFDIAFIGLASAAQVMIGNAIGRDDLPTAKGLSFRYVRLFIGATIAIGLVFAASTPFFASLFKLTPSTEILAERTMWVLAAFMIFKHINLLFIVGISRGGGDTTYAMKIEILNVWLLGVPLAFIGALVLDLPVYGVVALFSLEEAVKSIFSIIRIKNEKWINNVVHDL